LASEPLSPIALLIALLADPPDNPTDKGLVNDPEVWAAVKKHAPRHGVLQLVAFAARPHVSAAEREWCDQVLTRSWIRHNRSLLDLEHAIGILNEGGIRTIALKGPLLARRHYNPPFLRKPSADVDLAVRDADLERSWDLLRRAGYRAVLPLAEARARSHHFALTHPSQPPLELHHRLSHGAYGIPVGEFFGRAVPYILPSGKEAWVLSPADEIFHLVLHRAHGRFATLFHLQEIRRLWAAADPAVREETLRRAADFHFAGAFAMTDVAFRVRWGERFLADGDLPKTWLQSRITDDLYKKFEILSEPGRELPLSARLGRRWIDFQVTDRPADAARFAAIMLRVAWYQLWRRGWKTVRVE
jgi:hypothetical protein